VPEQIHMTQWFDLFTTGIYYRKHSCYLHTKRKVNPFFSNLFICRTT